MKINKTPKIVYLAIFAFIALVSCGLLGLWYQSKSEPSSIYVDFSTGKPSGYAPLLLYRGIKVPGTSFVLFKRYYGISEKDPINGIMTTIVFEKEGYNYFVSSYENGRIAGMGLCMVEKYKEEILHDLHNLKDAEFFNPDGQLVSSVENGSGVQILFSSNGTKLWELHLNNFKRRKLTVWNLDGSVKLNKEYD